VDKLRDVVGLYLNPPEHAFVLSIDEKTQIQALDRTQPALPFRRGHAGTVTHDYKRNGTTTLFAALNILKLESVSRNIGIRSSYDFSSGLTLLWRGTTMFTALSTTMLPTNTRG